MNAQTPRYRFAPSPTGDLHIGNAATTLLGWLLARWNKGRIILRIEDIDLQRSKPEYVDRISEDMLWLGLDWDEGPYFQSDRSDLYAKALKRLAESGKTYPCYCSRKDLMALASAPHGLQTEGPAYDGMCRSLSKAERQARALEKKPSIRFLIPHKAFYFTDGIRGEQAFEPGYGGDFVIRRSDEMWAYQLACTVDDLEMDITHVVRGADLLDSTPRQLALIEALGGKAPEYAHTPVWNGIDGHRLSKRHGAVSLREFREAGIPPEQMIGQLAWASGIRPKKSPCTVEELLQAGPQPICKEDVQVEVDAGWNILKTR